VAVGSAIGLLALAAIADGYILTTQLRNQADWLKRRFFVETLKSSVQSAPLTLLPVMRTPDDFLWGNNGPMEFIAYSATRGENAAERFRVLAYEELPGVLGELGGAFDRVNILSDLDARGTHALASATIDTIQRCYGNVKTKTGSFFVTLTLDRAALESPRCYSLTQLEPLAPSPAVSALANQPTRFSWQADSELPKAFRLQIEQRNPHLVWVEGESFPLQNGWMFEAKVDHYPGFSGTGYILDDVRSQETSVRTDVPEDATYQIWVRSLRGAKEGHRNFIEVGDQRFEFAQPNQVELGAWVWQMVGQVQLKKGSTQIGLSREYSKEGWKPVLIDAVFLSADPDFDPDTDELWTLHTDTGEIDSTADEYVIESGFPPGGYRWRVQLLDGDKLVDASGKRGFWSPTLEFTVK
jgi:hypothetical protein